MKKFILASSSPRRKELLNKLNIAFDVMSPNFDETNFELEPSSNSIEKLSLLKAKSISVILQVSAFVIGADTVVILDNIILGKPKNRAEAYSMLKLLSGKKHKVITGVSIVDTENQKEYSDSATTYVTFNYLSDEDIYNYIDTKKPYDKAGAYGIQELPENFLKKIDGEFDNVVGLPTNILIKMLKALK